MKWRFIWDMESVLVGYVSLMFSSTHKFVIVLLGRSIGGCTNVHATMYFIRSFSRARKPGVNHCTNQVQCDDVVGQASLVKLRCEKGYQVNVKYSRDYCMLCEGMLYPGAIPYTPPPSPLPHLPSQLQ